jgi:hypothetical protein
MNPYPAAAFRVPTIEAWDRRHRSASVPRTDDTGTSGALERVRGVPSAGRRLRRLAGIAAS